MDRAKMSLKWDVRMLEKNLQNGLLTKEEYEKHLKELPDLSSNTEPLDIEREDNGIH